jgi:aminobenzoyl-glutamate transport protein
MLALVAIVSHTGVDAGYVIVIPIGGVLFHAVGRHPVAGIAAAFAGVSGGFSANFIPSALDPMLQSLTQEGGQLLDPDLAVNPLCNWYFMGASSLLVVAIIWFLTDRVIEPRLNRTLHVDADAKDLPTMAAATPREITGFACGMATMVAALVGLYLWATVDGSSLADADGNLGTFNAPLIQSIVPILFVLGLLPGIVHGFVAGSLKTLNDIVKGMVESMAGMGHYLVIMFFAAQFVRVFGQSKLGELLAIQGATFLQESGVGASPTIVGLIFLVAIVNLLIGSASGKWGLLSVIFVPMLMELGYSPALTQAAYRVGDSSTNIITPLMPYFPLVVTYCQRYVKRTGIGTLISTMLPYSVTLIVCWSVFLLIYWTIGDLTGLPLGYDGGYTYSAGG